MRPKEKKRDGQSKRTVKEIFLHNAGVGMVGSRKWAAVDGRLWGGPWMESYVTQQGCCIGKVQ